MTYEFDLGGFGRPITTASAEAQAWFDRGLAWTYGFNHEEAIHCFRKALEADPDCAMAHWGLSYAIGPNYNKPWEAFDDNELTECLQAAFDSARQAKTLSATGTATERSLIDALLKRYPERESPGDMTAWNDAYAAAMRTVNRDCPGDTDVEALFAEALMNRSPWALWDLATGAIADGADTAEARAVLEGAMTRLSETGARPHPGLLHMYIHLMEMSPTPEKALPAGDLLRDLIPDAGHLQHMPTHIDVLCGDYLSVVDSNGAAILADGRYVEKRGSVNFYTLYRCHNFHFRAYGAMFLGQFGPALAAADDMIGTLPETLLRVESPPMADWLEGFVPVRQHVLIRFGKWPEILEQDLPRDPDLYSVTTATMRYARAIARASRGETEAADREAEAFDAAYDRVPESRYLFNNSCRDILAVAREMMRGEIRYRKGDIDAGFAHLRTAVKLDDSLPYDEPWGWMQPVRHALGALLLEQGRIDEAAAVYRADLGFDDTLSRACQHPDNVWSLSGYQECLERLGQDDLAAIVRQRLDLALARADVPIRTSCFCRLE
ncbi:MAG: tetratricopeptide repeat protein [Paracoccaceae bacterium]|nr:tetratricopeptide repeat protein [Paracoccaceae bacterium]